MLNHHKIIQLYILNYSEENYISLKALGTDRHCDLYITFATKTYSNILILKVYNAFNIKILDTVYFIAIKCLSK